MKLTAWLTSSAGTASETDLVASNQYADTEGPTGGVMKRMLDRAARATIRAEPGVRHSQAKPPWTGPIRC